MKVMENLEKEDQTVSGGCVVHCLNVTSRVKYYAFQINRLLQTEVNIQKNSIQEGEDCKNYGFTAPNGVILTKDKRDCRTFQLV